jgi:hypothetical protein
MKLPAHIRAGLAGHLPVMSMGFQLRSFRIPNSVFEEDSRASAETGSNDEGMGYHCDGTLKKASRFQKG